MKKETKNLKEGDVIYLKGRYAILESKVIDRVTNTMAFAGDKKFKISYDPEFFITEIGRLDKWTTNYWRPETDELKNEWFRQNTISIIKTHTLLRNMQKLTNEELQGLLDHMDNLNKQF